MSFHSCDTVPDEDLQLHPMSDFAKLIPVSDSAKLEFSKLASDLVADATILPHSRQFFHFESNDTPEFQWHGHYRFNLGLSPQRPKIGWVLGGVNGVHGPERADICLTSNPRRYKISSRHCNLAHHRHNNALMIAVHDKRTIIINGTEELSGEKRVLGAETGLAVGDLMYKLVFTDLSPDMYEQQLSEWRSGMQMSPSGTMPPFLTPTPSAAAYTLQGFHVEPPSKGGAQALVSFGWRRHTGDAVCIKKPRLTRWNQAQSRVELTLLCRLRHDNIATIAHDFRPNHDDLNLDLASDDVRELQWVMEPAAQNSMLKLPTQAVATSLVFLKDLISAVAYLHSQGVMHRDIKLENIGISLAPPKAVLLDLGHACSDGDSTDHGKGTIRYLAPEIIALKEWKVGEPNLPPYSQSVDVWSLGITLSEHLLQNSIQWERVTKLQWTRRITTLQERARNSPDDTKYMLDLVGRMMQWSPSDRPTADALRQEILQWQSPSLSPDSAITQSSKRRKTSD